MELLQLRYFCEIAKQGNISRAAELLHVTQPALSHTLKNLENELGVSLFDRTGKHLILNHNGNSYYSQIKKVLMLLDNAAMELRDNADVPCGHINLLILAASNIMPDLLINFHRMYPNISLNLKQQATHNLRQASDFDFVISATPGDYKGLSNIELILEDLVLAVHADHELAPRGAVNLIEAAPYPFVTYSQGPSVRELTDSLCLQAGFKPKIILESDNPGNYRTFIQNKMGIALIPYQTQRSMFNSLIVPVFLKSPECRRSLFLSYPEGHYLNHASRLFMQFCIDFFREIGRSER